MVQTVSSAAASPITRRRAWLIAIRPASLSASIAPVLVGTAAAGRGSSTLLGPFLAALLCAMLIQIGTNVTNDVYDFRSGADSDERLGPRRLILSGAVSVREGMIGAALIFGLAALLGLYLIWVGGWPIFLIGVLSIASGYAYTGGPWPLGYHGLGDLFSFTFFGPVAVLGSAYLQTHSFVPRAAPAGIAVGLLVAAILVVNNLRDIETDRRAGKHTLAVRMGQRATRRYYLLAVAGAYAAPPILWLGLHTSPLVFLSWLTVPLAYRNVRFIQSHDGPALNLMLKRTGQLNLLFGILLALGLLF